MNTDIKDARKKAMRLLEHMDRTEKGLHDRLLRDGFSEEAVDDALSYVKSYGYIDDMRYAENYILNRIHAKSQRKIFQDLKCKGIDLEIIQAAWEQVAQDEEPNERELLRRQIEKKYQPDTILDDKEKRRLYGYLARRGFKSEDIFIVLNEMRIS